MKFKSIENTKDPLGVKSFNFALKIILLFRMLQQDKKEYIISKQLFRSGTNPGAMIREARNAETGRDFIHKLAIGQKEICETQYWLELLNASDYISDDTYKSLFQDSNEIKKMLRSSIITKKKNLKIKLGLILLLLSSIIMVMI